MSRQHDRGDLPPEVRIRMAEDDLDRVDREFKAVDEKIVHKATNLDMAIRGFDLKHEKRMDEIESEFKEFKRGTTEEVAGNRKVMVGVLISTLSVAIAIVAQVLIMRGGGG